MPRTLSEAESKSLLAPLGIPFAPEEVVTDPDAAVDAANRLGMPVAAKLCGDNIAHKTERGLVRLGLSNADDVAAAAADLLAAARDEDNATGVLIAPMVGGDRELIAGASTDEQFGPTVLLGVGGVLAEAVADVSVRLAPITDVDANEMIEDLQSQAILGEFRGQPAVDREALVAVLAGLSEAISAPASNGATILSVDLNPLIISDGRPVAVDALVELEEAS
ncbi:MAG: carboxylate--amine ligase [Actinomycetia bacterium]|nr:carboxylate--amine ligase [Actinomycetes bacterium]